MSSIELGIGTPIFKRSGQSQDKEDDILKLGCIAKICSKLTFSYNKIRYPFSDDD